MQLHENITAYYLDHFPVLNSTKQFHFASRLAAWSNDPVARQHLRRLKSTVVPEPLTKEALQRMLLSLAAQHPTKPGNAAHLRARYLAAYPELYGISLALFRVRHLLEIYGIDARPALAEIAPTENLLKLQVSLLADKEATRNLSTHAINFIYLLNRLILAREDGFAIEAVYELGDGYDLADTSQLQLLIYLYTHCIIGESIFYARAIPAHPLPVYRRMLARLDSAIADHFATVSLDTKLEFLVCARLCAYQAKAEPDILKECEASVSPDGMFLVDTRNSFAELANKKSFEASEHRNVLFIMACTPRNLERSKVLG